MQRNDGWFGSNAGPIRYRLLRRLMLLSWLVRGSVRRSRVRFPGGAALNCWGGGTAQIVSSEVVDGPLRLKLTIFTTVRHHSPLALWRLSPASDCRIVLLAPVSRWRGGHRRRRGCDRAVQWVESDRYTSFQGGFLFQRPLSYHRDPTLTSSVDWGLADLW